jgi:hypothetical protein
VFRCFLKSDPVHSAGRVFSDHLANIGAAPQHDADQIVLVLRRRGMELFEIGIQMFQAVNRKVEVSFIE